MDRSSQLATTWRAQAIGIEQLPAFDPVTRAALNTPETVFAFQNREVQAHERLHGPIRFPNETQFENFIANLPEEIHDGKRVVRRDEILELVATIRFGNTTLDSLPRTHRIRDITEQFLRGVVLRATKTHPEILEARFHPFLGTPLVGVEARARLAEWYETVDRLAPNVRELLKRGYERLSPEDREEVIKNLYELHGGMGEFRGQPHTLYFVHPDLMYNRAHRDGVNPARVYDDIDALAADQNDHAMYELLAQQGAAIIGCEYKLHVLAKPELHPALVNRILAAVTHNPALNKNIIALKVRTDPEKNMPDIIIYARRGVTSTQAGTIATRIARALEKHLADFDSAAHYDGIPRYNLPLTNLLYIAQAGGDLKDQLRARGFLSHFFDETKNFAVLRPEFQT